MGMRTVACGEKKVLYQARDHKISLLWQVVSRWFNGFEAEYPQKYTIKYGFYRPEIRYSVDAFLKCGDLREGFARIRCPGCAHEMYVAFLCKQRCACPSCHQKRTLVTSLHVEQDVCFRVPHHQFVFTLPKRFRLYPRYDRSLLAKLSREAWLCTKQIYQEALGRDDVVPGMIAGIQTHGKLLHVKMKMKMKRNGGSKKPMGITIISIPIKRNIHCLEVTFCFATVVFIQDFPSVIHA